MAAMVQVALHLCERQIARRLLVACAVAAFVFLLASTAPHLVHHAGDAAHHELVACKLYTLAASVQWLILAAFPALSVWLIHRLMALRHEDLLSFWIGPLPRGRAPPPSLS